MGIKGGDFQLTDQQIREFSRKLQARYKKRQISREEIQDKWVNDSIKKSQYNKSFIAIAYSLHIVLSFFLHVYRKALGMNTQKIKKQRLGYYTLLQ